MNHYVILGPKNRRSAICGTVFRDVWSGKVEGARYLNISSLFSPLRLAYHALTHRGLRRALRKLPRVRALLDRAAARVLEKTQRPRLGRLRALLSEDSPNVLLFVPGTHLQLLPAAAIDSIGRALPECRRVFYLIDGIERTAQICKIPVGEVLEYLRHFDAAFTYDRTDVASHPDCLRFIDIPLWRAPESPAGDPAFSLYFCGRNKKRGELLLAIHRRLTEAGLRFRLEIVGWGSNDRAHPDISHSSWVPYERYVRSAQDSNCILEVLAVNNNESTLRYKEAVMYNKKLLTTNAAIPSLPYYDPRWMRVFQTAEDIDLDWLRAVEPVDYGYRGDYSAEVFLRRVGELLQSRA